ncbi:B-cell receptor-associated protein 31-like-domain-containing protein [Geopyxis carbonaria]|nr:B-cell receptor-associated protein 31-like-domain-containing protein [Geopyxis carbonaria]
MTLYYSLVFFLLVSEMSIFLMLILPLPFTWRKRMFEFIQNSPVIAKFQYGMKITFIFILILFIDSVNRVYRVQRELSDAASQGGRMGQGAVMGHERMEVQARKFYSQRNMYLCGFTLFLSLILNRTYTFILDILKLETTVKELRSESNERVRNGSEAALLAKKDKEIEAIKLQAEGLSREYSELSDRYEKLEKMGSVSTPKKDL